MTIRVNGRLRRWLFRGWTERDLFLICLCWFLTALLSLCPVVVPDDFGGNVACGFPCILSRITGPLDAVFMSM